MVKSMLQHLNQQQCKLLGSSSFSFSINNLFYFIVRNIPWVIQKTNNKCIKK